MSIVAEDIEKVRKASDIVDVISQHAQVKKVGRQWMARCPLHGERTPSMSVSREKGVFYCFGCQRSGDVITFVREVEGLEFVAAVEFLASRCGIALRYTSTNESSARSRRRKLVEAVTKAAEFYHDKLLNDPEAGPARSYLRSRGYDGDIVRQFQIGWAPSGWDELASHLGLNNTSLQDSGLGFQNRSGRQQDFFRSRIMFPIADESGDHVGFGGRIMPEAEGPKYLNSSSRAIIYDKSKVLYGLNLHRASIVNAGEVVVCEGYTDVIGCAAAGVTNAVATCGTALTEEHVKLLKRFSVATFILAFDADTAGGAAAERIYEWEDRYDVVFKVADFPAGSDPGNLAQNAPQTLKDSVANAMPMLAFRIDRALSKHDLGTPEGSGRAAKAVAHIIAEHPNEMVRDGYIMSAADRCHVDNTKLRQAVVDAKKSTSQGKSNYVENAPEDFYDNYDYNDAGDNNDGFSSDNRDKPSDAAQAASRELTSEDEALRLVIHHRDKVQSWLHPTLFEDPLRREAYEALVGAESILDANEQASLEAGALINRLAVDPGSTDIDDVLAGRALAGVTRATNLLRRALRQATDDDLKSRLSANISWLQLQPELLRDSLTRSEVLSIVLPWLVEFGTRAEANPEGDLLPDI